MRVHVEALAAGGPTSVEAPPVPGGVADAAARPEQEAAGGLELDRLASQALAEGIDVAKGQVDGPGALLAREGLVDLDDGHRADPDGEAIALATRRDAVAAQRSLALQAVQAVNDAGGHDSLVAGKRVEDLAVEVDLGPGGRLLPADGGLRGRLREGFDHDAVFGGRM
ncbi:hypothetical protein D3C72_1812760 [compost metagenome]